jgi:hypothetical protein
VPEQETISTLPLRRVMQFVVAASAVAGITMGSGHHLAK